MTLISSISNIGSINKNTLKNNSTSLSNEKINSSITMTSGGVNQTTGLLDTKIMANLLCILGITVKAKVLSCL